MKINFLGKWVYCIILYYKSEFQETDNLHLVHEDYKNFVRNNLTNTFYNCIGNDGQFLILKTKKFELKVKTDAIKGILSTPKFSWEDQIREVERPGIIGIIDDLIWHQNKSEYIYYISINGKRKSRRYMENELVKVIKPT